MKIERYLVSNKIFGNNKIEIEHLFASPLIYQKTNFFNVRITLF